MTPQISKPLAAVVTAAFPKHTTLHAWIKAAIPGMVAELRVTLNGTDAGTVSAANSEEFVFCTLDLAESGSAVLSYDPQITIVSVVYVFQKATVMQEGITVLYHAPAIAPPASCPLYHFTPPFGWMNDPNGFGRFGGKPHLFYQHYPHSLRWNTMHWGHAVSDDFLRWRHLPMFLMPNAELSQRPDGRGGVFSGSAIAEDDGAIRVFYTEQVKDRTPEEQNQWSAVSTDGLTAGHAALVVPERPAGLGLTLDFRDPYVIKGPDGLWKMLLGSRDSNGGIVLLYETQDPSGATGWNYRGILHRENRFGMTAAECPCLLPLGPVHEVDTRWALIFALLTSRCPDTGRRNLTIATVGRFDGGYFTPEFEQELDFGTDAYAFQGFPDGDNPVMIAWLANWTDVSKKQDFQSAMTLPRRLLLKDGALYTPPVDAIKNLRQKPLDTERLVDGNTLALEDGAAEFLLELGTAGAPFTLEFDHPDVTLAVTQGPDGLAIVYQPSNARTAPHYLARDAAAWSVRIFIDRGSIEVFADGGRWVGTKRLATFEPVFAARLVSGAKAVCSVSAWRLGL